MILTTKDKIINVIRETNRIDFITYSPKGEKVKIPKSIIKKIKVRNMVRHQSSNKPLFIYSVNKSKRNGIQQRKQK